MIFYEEILKAFQKQKVKYVLAGRTIDKLDIEELKKIKKLRENI